MPDFPAEITAIDPTFLLGANNTEAAKAAITAKGRTLIASADVEPLTAAEKSKLAGIASGATANATDAQLRDRSTHTGTQAISTVTGLQAALDAKQATLTAGTGITIVDNTISATATGSALSIRDEGTEVTAGATSINFTGAAITVTAVGTNVTVDVAGGGGGGATNLSTSADATTVTVASDTGTDAVLTSATGSVAGIMTAADKSKLDGIAANATANATDAQLRDRSTHTGTQLAATVSDFAEAVDDRVSNLLVAGTNVTLVYDDTANTLTISAAGGGGGGGGGATNLSTSRDATSVTILSDTGTDAVIPAASATDAGVLVAADKSKLDGIAAGATANATDAQLRDRSTHTGTQLAATISDFAATASAAAPVQSVASKTGAVTLVKADVGLANVDNTADADKPVSTAQQTALNGKQNTLVSGTNIRTVNGQTLLGAGDLVISSATNLTASVTATNIIVQSDTGTDATLPAATGTEAGLLLPAEKTKLAGIATGATANATDAELRDRATHTGTQTSATISDLVEAVQDIVGAFVTGGAGITVVYNDASNTLQIINSGTVVPFTIPYAASFSVDVPNSVHQKITLTGNAALTAITNMSEGQEIILVVRQDATGGRTLSFPPSVLFQSGVDPVPDPLPNAITTITMRMVDGLILGVAGAGWA